jgi:hypothetical protein
VEFGRIGHLAEAGPENIQAGWHEIVFEMQSTEWRRACALYEVIDWPKDPVLVIQGEVQNFRG